ncbi:MAG: IS3 family transposase [Dehalococcoidia bacterium]|nr:IS3 family transposase [Dehalococcoidia bacterium]
MAALSGCYRQGLGKRFNKLREAEIHINQGISIAEASRMIGVTQQTYYRWRKEYGGLRIEQARKLKNLEKENARLKKLVADLALDNAILKRGSGGKLLSPSRKRKIIIHIQEKLSVSQRRACRVLRQARKTQRRVPRITDEEARLVERVIALATRYGRYGYRRITAMLRHEGWQVNHKRVERIWRREGLKVPKKQPKRGRLWLNDGSCIRLRPEYEDHVWSYDFMAARTADGRALRIFNIIDEYTRQCLATLVKRRITSEDVIDQLFNLFIFRAIPEHIRSDNGPEFTTQVIRRWLNRLGVKTLFIEPGSPWENGYIESFNGKLRDELLNRETFYTLIEAKVLIEQWRKEYNQVRTHSSLNYRPPAPEARMPAILT